MWEADGRRWAVRCEKQQVLALAEWFGRNLADAPAEPTVPPPEVTEPPGELFRLGTVGVAWDPGAARFVLELGELTDDPDEPPVVRARLGVRPGQAAGFVARAAELAAAGRPPCPWCARPMDPEGHVCPRSNGQRPS